MKTNTRILVLLVGMLFSVSTFAAAVIETLTGQARAGASSTTATAVQQGAQVKAGTMVVTGPKSTAILRFDDGQAMVLAENTEFRVAEYAFTQAEPKKDKFVFELLKGALRSITAAFTSRNAGSYALRIPQGTVGIRGTDFMVQLVNPAYFGVLSGAISVGTGPGAVTIGAGSYGFAASSTVLASTIPAGALPGAVATTFGQLSSITVGAGAAGAGAAAAGGVGPGAIAVGAAVAAGVAAAAGGDDSTVGTTATTGTTP